MWARSASFILDKRNSPLPADSDMAVSAYYRTRSEQHAVVSSDWLAQAQAAAGGSAEAPRPAGEGGGGGRGFSVIDEFDYWRKQPDLAEAVAAIMALTAVSRSSEATTMMELEIELRKASDTLKVLRLDSLQHRFMQFVVSRNGGSSILAKNVQFDDDDDKWLS